jgi:hypothetical protein
VCYVKVTSSTKQPKLAPRSHMGRLLGYYEGDVGYLAGKYEPIGSVGSVSKKAKNPTKIRDWRPVSRRKSEIGDR